MARIEVWHHLFYLFDPSSWDASEAVIADSLVLACQGGIGIRTGVYGGPVNVETALLPTEPPLEEGWEDRADAEILMEGDTLIYSDLESFHQEAGVTYGGGQLAARVYAKGRGIAFDLIAEEPVESYLVQLWPAPAGAPSHRRSAAEVASERPPRSGAGSIHGTYPPTR